MSYHPVKVAPLSHAQTLKLLKGEPITVKRGTHHTINMSESHAKKMHKKILGKGMRIQLDPYAIDMNRHLHGEGFFSSLKKGASALASNPTVKALGKQAAQTAINYAVQKASPYAEQYGLQGALGSAADMASSHVEGMGMRIPWSRKIGRPRKHPMQGKGMFGNLAKMGKSALKNPAIRGMVTSAANQALASQGLPPMAGEAMSMAGLGMRRRGRPRKHMGGALYLA